MSSGLYFHEMDVFLPTPPHPPGAHMIQGAFKKNPAAAREWRRRVGVVDCAPEWDIPQMLDSAAVGAGQETDLS